MNKLNLHMVARELNDAYAHSLNFAEDEKGFAAAGAWVCLQNSLSEAKHFYELALNRKPL